MQQNGSTAPVPAPAQGVAVPAGRKMCTSRRGSMAGRVVAALALLAALAAPVCATAQTTPTEPPRDWVATGERAGPITRDTTEADLRRLFGGDHVRALDVYVGEGEFEPGTVVLPDDPPHTLQITWIERDGRRVPLNIFFRPLDLSDGNFRSGWATPEGITLGTGLRRLQELNGRPFSLMGLAWDFGGTIMSWEGGRLERTLQGPASRLILRVGERAGMPPPSVDVVGDEQLSSDHAELQRLDPVVEHMILTFDQPVE